MGKRPKVPAALHSEFTEYSSLLRALRTSNTLDLASQLTAPVPTTTRNSLHEDDGASDPSLADEGESERPLTETVTNSQDHPEGSQQPEDPAVREVRRDAKRKARNSKAPRDTWTRWPLLAGDVYVPEWSLEDEVRSIAAQALHAQWRDDSPLTTGLDQAEEESVDAEQPADPTPADHGPVDATLTLEDEASGDVEGPESLLTPPVLSGLTSSTARFLSQLLALLAAYVPPGEKSMQNRVRPVNWESVLDIATVHGLVDYEYVLHIAGCPLSSLTGDQDSGDDSPKTVSHLSYLVRRCEAQPQRRELN